MIATTRTQRALFAAVALIVVVVLALVPAIPQDPAYHEFADTRLRLGVPNAWNVLSNLPFLFAGAAGLIVVYSRKQRHAALTPVYAVFFVGVLLTAFGSSYYHWSPGNGPLVWDRLPMTIAIMGLLAAIIGEYGNVYLARRCLPYLLLAGFLSVFYWHWTETRGAGDLRPYAIVQFLPLVVLLVVLISGKRRPFISAALWLMLLFYVVAKLLEHYDAMLFAHLPVSGHSLKHIAAAIGPLFLVWALYKRNTDDPR